MVKKRVNEVLGDKMDAFDEWLKSSAKNATVNMEQGLSFSFRRRGQPIIRTAAGTPRCRHLWVRTPPILLRRVFIYPRENAESSSRFGKSAGGLCSSIAY